MSTATSELTDIIPTKWVAKRLRALRAFSFPMSILPVLISVAAVRHFTDWDIPILITSVLGAVLLHATGNLLNDYFDFRFAVDHKLDDDEGRPGRLLVRGELKPCEILFEGLFCLVLVLPCAVFLVWKCGTPILIIGLIAAAAAYAYTGPPFHLKYRALGEPLIFLVFGLLPIIGAAYAQLGYFEWRVLLLAIPVGFPITAVVAANNLRDEAEDHAAGIRTLAQLADGRIARVLYAVLIILSPLSLVVLGILGIGPYWLAITPIALILIWRPLLTVLSRGRIPDIDAITARYATILMLLTLIVLITHGGLTG